VDMATVTSMGARQGVRINQAMMRKKIPCLLVIGTFLWWLKAGRWVQWGLSVSESGGGTGRCEPDSTPKPLCLLAEFEGP
jgi:hypothetical protein